MTRRLVGADLWVLPLPELMWWLRVQGVYARSIGESFAKAANDNGFPKAAGR